MKPIELLKKLGYEDRTQVWNYTYSPTWRSIGFYIDEDCVIAYSQGDMGTLFLIKGKRSYITFLALSKDFRGIFFSQILVRRITNKDFSQVVTTKGLVIADKDKYKSFQDDLLLENL